MPYSVTSEESLLVVLCGSCEPADSIQGAAVQYGNVCTPRPDGAMILWPAGERTKARLAQSAFFALTLKTQTCSEAFAHGIIFDVSVILLTTSHCGHDCASQSAVTWRHFRVTGRCQGESTRHHRNQNCMSSAGAGGAGANFCALMHPRPPCCAFDHGRCNETFS